MRRSFVALRRHAWSYDGNRRRAVAPNAPRRLLERRMPEVWPQSGTRSCCRRCCSRSCAGCWCREWWGAPSGAPTTAIGDQCPLCLRVIVDETLKSGSIAESCPSRTRVRRPVAPPSQDDCRSGTASVHPRRGARHRLPCLRRARACRRDLCHQLTSPPRSGRYRR